MPNSHSANSDPHSANSPSKDEAQRADDALLDDTALDDTALDDAVLGRAAEGIVDELIVGSGPQPGGDALKAQLAEAEQRALRAQAEAENVRKRMRRDMNDQLRYAAVALIRDLLPVVDNVHRAIEAAEKSGEASSLLEGVKMIAKQLETTLAQHSCKRIEAVGRPFDPHLHEAILQQPSDEHAAGVVAAETTGGFQLHDRVVRPSQVIISTGPADSEETKD